MLHHGSVGRVQNREYCYSISTYFFFTFFVIFRLKNVSFIVFIYFFEEVSNLCKRISTSQKQKLVIRNCQWNRKFSKCVNLYNLEICKLNLQPPGFHLLETYRRTLLYELNALEVNSLNFHENAGYTNANQQ